jgi:hypothetical protein
MLIQIMLIIIFFMYIGIWTLKAEVKRLEAKLEQYEVEE